MYQNKIFRLALSFCFLLLGCSSPSRNETPDNFAGETPTPTLQAGTPEPLCPRNSTYQIQFEQLNTPISQCKLFFYVAFLDNEGDERWLQVIVQPNNPFTFYDNGIVDYASINQIKPYWYRWVIKDEQGQVQRAWLAYFIENRDGLYHTIITQSEQDWHNSYLEIFFEDTNNDHVREDVTYEIVIDDFLEYVHP